MAKNTSNARSYSDGAVYVGPLGSVAPTTLAAVSAAYTELGWLADKGITESPKVTTKPIKGWQGGTTVRTLKSDWSDDIQFEALEENAVVLGLRRPGSVITKAAGTSEQQTVTLTGATGGTFALSYGGAITSALAFNAAASAIQTALQALITVGTGNATVAGSAGGPYTVTFAGALASRDVAAIAADASLLTGTSPTIAVATTVPGVGGLTTTQIKPYLGQDLRSWVIDLFDGPITRRLIVPNGEVDASGAAVAKSDELIVYPFTLTPYPDVNGVAIYEISNNPAL